MNRRYDVLVVGGGTAGAVLAARLSQDPRRSVGLLEWGPDDRDEPRALQIRRWFEMLEGEYDLDYRSVPAERGNSEIRQARVSLAGPDPDAPPLIDYRAFTDLGGHDEQVLLAGMRMARRVAATAPMSGWVARELFPGPDVVDGDELSAVMRATHHTVYHVSCTCRMGADDDPLAVLDPELRVRGVRGLSVADASAFPSLTTVNPVVAVLMLAERAADLIARRT